MTKMLAATVAVGAMLVSGAALAVDNDENVYLRVSEVNTMLVKANTKLADADVATAPPAQCVPKQPGYACAAVSQLDKAHDQGLTALLRVDAIEKGQSAASLARRLGRVADTADANRDIFGGIISPDFAGIISPDFAGIISPDLVGIISPDFVGIISPDITGIVGPEIDGIISPDRTAELEGIMSPELSGIVGSERDRILDELDTIIARAEADLVLAHAMRRSLGGQ